MVDRVISEWGQRVGVGVGGEKSSQLRFEDLCRSKALGVAQPLEGQGTYRRRGQWRAMCGRQAATCCCRCCYTGRGKADRQSLSAVDTSDGTLVGQRRKIDGACRPSKAGGAR